MGIGMDGEYIVEKFGKEGGFEDKVDGHTEGTAEGSVMGVIA